MGRTRNNLMIQLVWLMGLVSWAQASTPRHTASNAELRHVAATLSQPSPRAPHPRNVVSADGVVTYTNDAAGNLTGMTDPWGTGPSSAAYENAGRLASWTDHHGATVQYHYNKAGAVTNISYPGNLSVSYGWDVGGRLASVKDWAGHTWTFAYDGANRLTGIGYPNGVSYTRAHNADGQITNYVYSKSGTAFVSRGIDRNAVGLKPREVIGAGLAGRLNRVLTVRQGLP